MHCAYFEHTFLTDNLNDAVDFLSWIRGMQHIPKWRGSGQFYKIIGQT